MRLVLGGYTSDAGGGLGAVTLTDGAFGTPELVAEAPNPSFLVVAPDGRFVYAVLEGDEGGVGAWVVGSSGPWAPLGVRSTGGSAPCQLSLSPCGRFVVVANYGSGSVSVHRVLSDGSLSERTDLVVHAGPLGPVGDRQEGPHAHEAAFGPLSHLFTCDLGLDAVITYRLDADSAALTEVARSSFAPGTGPRHLAFSPDGSVAFVVGELSSTVTVCSVEGAALTAVSTVSSRAAGAVGESYAAEILMSGDGSQLFVSNRGDDSVACFSVEEQALTLDEVVDCGGHWPRFITFGEDESTLLVTNERSDSVAVLQRAQGGWAVTGSVAWPKPTAASRLA